jgi:hypothetical protein
MKRLFAAFALLALSGVVSVHAGTIVYEDPAGQGTQGYTGNLGLNFTVNSPVTVTALGVFNASGSGTISGTLHVVIFDMTSLLWVTPVVTFHGAYTPEGFGYDVFQPITPVTLQPGPYQVDATGFNSNDLNGDTVFSGSSSGPVLNNLGGAITFTGARFKGSLSLVNGSPPLQCPSCSNVPSAFDAGTFQVGAAGTPEPGSFGLFGCGFIALTVVLRRSRLARRSEGPAHGRD